VRPVHGVDPLPNLNADLTGLFKLRRDRLLTSVVPGPVRNHENVAVALGPSGSPESVVDRQRLLLHGTGNYTIRELGPARAATPVGATVPPVLELGTVVWMGFSPGRRSLDAALTLDPGIEARRLPLTVGFAFRTDRGQAERLEPGGVAPADGTLTITLSNNTSSSQPAEVGVARAGAIAAAMSRLARAAAHPRPGVPPAPGAGLPARLPGCATGRQSLPVAAPVRVTGSITAPGGAAAVTGPGTTPAAGGVTVAGTLTAQASFTVRLRAGQRVGLRLDAQPWLDPRTLQPPAPYRSWAAWRRAAPSRQALAAATERLVAAAATAARAADYSPYLQADTPGPDASTFSYAIAPAPRHLARPLTVRPRPGPLAAAAVALLAIVGNATLLWRHL
jgi:hypothetical protein